MKGAFLVAEDERLFDTVRHILVSLGGVVSADEAVVQLRDETGGLLTAYRVPPEAEWEFRTGELKPAPFVKLPDLSRMKGIAIECRSEFTFSTTVKAIAERSAEDMWVVDGDGTVWRAAEVNADQVRL